jgi:hypothetical protein
VSQQSSDGHLDAYSTTGSSPPATTLPSSRPEPLLTARQVAEYLQVSPRRVVDLWKAGHLRGFWLSPSGRRDLRFRWDDVVSFLADREHVLAEAG